MQNILKKSQGLSRVAKSRCSDMFCKNTFLKNIAKLIERESFFFNKVAGFGQEFYQEDNLE